MEKKKDSSHLNGLTEVDMLGVATVTERGKHHLAVKFLGPVPSEIAGDQAQHRFVLEGEEMVRTFHGDINGDTLIVDDETVPATYAALKGAAGKNLIFYRLS
jgi:hypothetical protein